MHRMTLGDFELTILSDGIYHNDGGALFGVIPKVMWEKRAAPDELNRIPMGTNSLLVRTGEHNVLIDTGIGGKLSDKRRAIYNHEPRLLKSFAEAGVSPDEIDIVINTHLHFDHCGWNTYYKDGKAVPTFPRATYYVQEGELQHAHEQHERDRVSYMTDNYDPLVASGQMKLLKDDTGDCAGHFGEGLSRAHARSAGGRPAQRRTGGVLSQRSGARHQPPRTHVGAGLRSIPAAEHRQ